MLRIVRRSLVRRGVPVLARVLLLQSCVAAATLAQAPPTLDHVRALFDAARDRGSVAIEAELGGWPEAPGSCSGLEQYLANLGALFRQRCGPEIGKKLAALDWRPATGTTEEEQEKRCFPAGGWTELGPHAALDLIGCLREAGTGALEVTAYLTRCTLTSYVLAAELTEEQRAGWETFLDGAVALTELWELTGLFASDEDLDKSVAALRAHPAPRTLESASSYVKQVRAVREELARVAGERGEQLTAIPEQLQRIHDAAGTLEPIAIDRLRARRDEAISTLDSCQPEEAEALATTLRLDLERRLRAQRAAVVLAEKRYWCALHGNQYDHLDPLHRDHEFFGVPSSHGRIESDERQDWQAANRHHRELLALYGELAGEPRLSEAAFAAQRARRERKRQELRDAGEQVVACATSCGRVGEGGCRFDLDLLERLHRGYLEEECGRAGLAVEHFVEARLDLLEVARLAQANADDVFARRAGVVRRLAAACDGGATVTELAGIGAELAALRERLGGGEGCWEGRYAELEREVVAARDRCSAVPPREPRCDCSVNSGRAGGASELCTVFEEGRGSPRIRFHVVNNQRLYEGTFSKPAEWLDRDTNLCGQQRDTYRVKCDQFLASAECAAPPAPPPSAAWPALPSVSPGGRDLRPGFASPSAPEGGGVAGGASGAAPGVGHTGPSAPPAVPLPDLRGLPAARAKTELERAGFVPRVVLGAPASSPERAFTVAEQEPPGGRGALLAPGEEVALRLHGPYSPAPAPAAPEAEPRPAPEWLQRAVCPASLPMAGGESSPPLLRVQSWVSKSESGPRVAILCTYRPVELGDLTRGITLEVDYRRDAKLAAERGFVCRAEALNGDRLPAGNWRASSGNSWTSVHVRLVYPGPGLAELAESILRTVDRSGEAAACAGDAR